MGLFSGCLGYDGNTDASNRPVRRVNKDMIGKPTNFQHTAHFGAEQWSQEAGNGISDPSKLQETLSQVQAQVMAQDPLRMSLANDGYRGVPLQVN